MSDSHGIIIHVEDEPGLRELVREALVEDGWQVISLATGLAGLEALAQHRPTLLLLDYALPDMLGTQFLDRLAARGAPLPPFIVTTGMGNEQLAVEMMKRGASDYLVKDHRFLEQVAPVVRRAANEALLAQRLAQSELQLRFLAQYSADVLTIVERNGSPRFWGPSAELLTGYRAEELPCTLLGLVCPCDKDLAEQWWERVHQAQAECLSRATFRLVRKDDTMVWVEAIGQNHLDNPVIGGVLVNMRDMTANKAAEAEQLEMERQLLHAQKLESLGVLAGGIAHDFNNLLAVVMGNLDLALSDLSEQADARESVELALKATHRAAVLTRQMLAYSGRGTFTMEPMRLGDLVRENSQIFAVSVSRAIKLLTAIEPGTPEIMANPGQIQQIVMNLLTNASEAIGERAGCIELSVKSIELDEARLEKSLVETRPSPGRFAQLTVRDSGCGMPTVVLERLFDPFFTTKRTGRGLGMAAVLGIVRGHGGALFVESQPGRGSKIDVCFPCKPERAISERPAPTQLTGELEQICALVVDDDPAVRATAVRLLRHLGATTLEAVDGLDAIRIVTATPKIDVILMDLTMPNLGGREATQQLAVRGDSPPVILCSGYGEVVLAADQTTLGASAFLEKPFRVDELRQVVARVIRPKA